MSPLPRKMTNRTFSPGLTALSHFFASRTLIYRGKNVFAIFVIRFVISVTKIRGNGVDSFSGTLGMFFREKACNYLFRFCKNTWFGDFFLFIIQLLEMCLNEKGSFKLLVANFR